MENVVLLKDPYDSLTFDSYDLIPTLETLKIMFLSSLLRKNEYQTQYILNDKELIKFSYFYFYNGVFRNLRRLVSFKNNIKILAEECYF